MIVLTLPEEIEGKGTHGCLLESLSFPNAARRGIEHIPGFNREFLSINKIVRLSFYDEGKIMEINFTPRNLPIREGSAINEQKTRGTRFSYLVMSIFTTPLSL